MQNTNILNLKSDERKLCTKCRLNGAIKKYKFICRGNVPKYLCHVCLKNFSSGAEALDWLNTNSTFYFEKKAQEVFQKLKLEF